MSRSEQRTRVAGANGFAVMALAFTAIAANEARSAPGSTALWASRVAAIAGAASFVGWVLWSWLNLGFGAPIWLIGSIVMCLWLAWFGLSVARVETGRVGIRRDAPSGA